MLAGQRSSEVHPGKVGKTKGKKDRTYMWNVLASVRPSFVRQLVDHANNLREVDKAIPATQKKIKVCEEVVKMFTNMTYVSRKYSLLK